MLGIDSNDTPKKVKSEMGDSDVRIIINFLEQFVRKNINGGCQYFCLVDEK